MITKPQDVHVHSYKKKTFKKVLLYKITDRDSGGSSVTGKDKLLLRLCACGKYQAYDLERTLA